MPSKGETWPEFYLRWQQENGNKEFRARAGAEKSLQYLGVSKVLSQKSDSFKHAKLSI